MAKEFITIDASAMEGVDYAAYLADYFVEQAGATRGAATYYDSTYFPEMFGYYDADQIGVRYGSSTNSAQVLMEGDNMQYDGVEGIHGSYSGEVDSVTFGYYDANTQFLQNSTERSSLIGVIQELKISGLNILEQVGAGTGADNDFYTLLNALRDANLTTVTDPNMVMDGELAIQKLYEMFAARAQHFIGSDGNDIYVGTRFGDKIDGGAGFDTLSGGKGKDVFVFDLEDSAATSDGADIIVDFNGRKDHLDFSLVDTNPEKDGDQGFKFLGTKDFTGKAGQINYERVDGQTHVHLDIDGNSEADMTIILDGNFKLAADDFFL